MSSSPSIAVQMDNAPSTPTEELADFDQVARQYWPRIFRFVLASVRDRDVAESLTQDCFLRAYQGRHRFRGDASVNTWLTQIAINLVRDFGRNRRLQFWRRAEVRSIDPAALTDWMPTRDASAEASAVARDQMKTVWRITASLPERQRTVFLLRFVEDMELLQIAGAMGTSEGAVKVHLFRAVHAVRKRMEGMR